MRLSLKESPTFIRLKALKRVCVNPLLQLALAFPVWWVLSLGNVVASIIAISIALGIGTWGMFGTQAALMPELFGSRHRYMGVSIAREASAVIAGGIAPMIGAGIIALVVASHDCDASAGVKAWLPIACYLTLLTLITLYTTFKTPETLNRDLDEPRDAWEIASAATAIPVQSRTRARTRTRTA